MVNGLKDFLFRPIDLGRQKHDAVFEFGNGEGIEILLAQQFDDVAFHATGKKVVRVHAMNVDPSGPPVNKRRQASLRGIG